MDRQDIAYFVNSTPKYYYLLPLHFALVRRYAGALKWPLYIATEEPTNPVIQEVSKKYNVNILSLKKEDEYFLESRLATTDALPSSVRYILPIQEDFLLGARIDEDAIREALDILDADADVLSIRLMPCPGPPGGAPFYELPSGQLPQGQLPSGQLPQGQLPSSPPSGRTSYQTIQTTQPMPFTYQATIFRREVYATFMAALIDYPEAALPIPFSSTQALAERKKAIQIKYNIAEQQTGQNKFRELFGKKKHIGWPRQHPHPNAVFLCPWPYRPTAVERGQLQPWVREFAEREGFLNL